jgi:hypothetical protein
MGGISGMFGREQGWEKMERDHLESTGVIERIILRWILRKWGMRVWNGSIWLRIGTSGEQLRMR